MSEEYRTVTVVLRAVRGRALIVEVPRQQGIKVIPRSLIHGGDDLRLDRQTGLPVKTTFRVMRWKADELGLA